MAVPAGSEDDEDFVLAGEPVQTESLIRRERHGPGELAQVPMLMPTAKQEPLAWRFTIVDDVRFWISEVDPVAVVQRPGAPDLTVSWPQLRMPAISPEMSINREPNGIAVVYWPAEGAESTGQASVVRITTSGDLTLEPDIDRPWRRDIGERRIDGPLVNGPRWPQIPLSDEQQVTALDAWLAHFPESDAVPEDRIHDLRVEVVEPWPDTRVVVTLRHPSAGDLLIRRTFRVFDPLGRVVPPFYPWVFLQETVLTGDLPPRSAARNGVLDV